MQKMMNHLILAALVAGGVHLVASSRVDAQEQLDCIGIEKDTPFKTVTNCFVQLQRGIETLRLALTSVTKNNATLAREVERLKATPPPAVQQVRAAFPVGAVVAFDLSNGCPTGWDTFSDSAGRFLLGVGDGRRFNETGGEKQVTLTRDELPNERLDVVYLNGPPTLSLNTSSAPGHQLLNKGDNRTAAAVNEIVTEPLGKGQPHNNMPPFIALHFCEFVGTGG